MPRAQSLPSNNYFRFLLRIFVYFFLPDGQGQCNRSAVMQDAIHADFSVVATDVGLADAQAQAGAASALGGEKWFEDVSQNVRRDTGAGVADAQLDRVDIGQLAGDDRDAAT